MGGRDTCHPRPVRSGRLDNGAFDVAAGEGGRFSVSAVDSTSLHQHESEVLLRAGAGTNEDRG